MSTTIMIIILLQFLIIFYLIIYVIETKKKLNIIIKQQLYQNKEIDMLVQNAKNQHQINLEISKVIQHYSDKELINQLSKINKDQMGQA